MNLLKKYISNIERAILYEAWISPNMVIPPISKIESNPIIGGVYKLYSLLPVVSVMNGEFHNLIKNEALIYSWHWEGNNEHTIVNVIFEDVLEGTAIIIKHTGFQTEESKAMHSLGWDSYFEQLEQKILEDLKIV